MSNSIQIRKYRAADLPAMVRITNARSIAMDEPPACTEERLLRRFDQFIFGLEAERDIFLAWKGEKCTAYTYSMLNGDHSTGYIDTVIDPSTSAREVLQPLQDAAEKHLRQTLGGDQLPPERPFFIDTFAHEHAVDQEKLALFQQLGYFEVRRFYDMLIQFEDDLQPATMPAGLKIRPFHLESEARSYHSAYLESFRDHWGNISIYDFEQFAKHFENPDFNESLWFGAWDGDELAGVMFGEPSQTHRQQRGVVDLLGVRRPWRRRGLGMALLHQAFYAFQQQGFTEAELGVDSESRTNAVSLYERAGMHAYREEIVLRKMIWGRPEDIVE